MKQCGNETNYHLFRLIICLLLIINYFPIDTVLGSVSSGDNWNIQIDELNLNGIMPEAVDQNKQSENEELPPGIYSGNNYRVKLGFDSLDPFDIFTFGITNSIIDYGHLSPTNPVYRSTNIFVSNYNKKFIVVTYQDHPLLLKGSNIFLHDTTCDNGYCTQIRSDIWENTLTYGFGYRCDDIKSKYCPTQLSKKNYYKQFSDLSKKEIPQIIMSGISSENNHETQITYKLNISKPQPIGSYSNTITYIASPGY